MCGRTALTASPEELREILGLREVPDDLAARYNVPPSQPVAVVRVPGKVELLRWGLVPFWAATKAMGHRLALARFESVRTTPAFRDAIRRRRCIVIVSGFYEWQRAGHKTESRPFFIRRPDEKPFGLAGVWDRWVSGDGEVVESCAILTTASEPPIDVVHDRMPLVLDLGMWDAWLDRTVGDVGDLEPFAAADLIAIPVGRYVNDPGHDDPGCLRPEPERAQGVLFG
jgi:putative SOS response-associated peptidase YedK